MSQFTDLLNRTWQVTLTVPVIQKIKNLHKIEITNLETDPLQKLRNDPLVLVAVVYLVCEKQIEKLGVDPDDFAESLPSPPDAMLEAVGDSIVNFYPSGRASHVREALTKFAEMNAKSDEIAIAKMTAVIADTRTTEMLSRKADQIYTEEMAKIFGEKAGT